MQILPSFSKQIKIPSTNYPENYKTWVLSDLCERSQHCRFVVICKMCLSSLSSIVKITIYLSVINNLPYEITALNLNSLSQVKLHRLKSITYLLTIWSVQSQQRIALNHVLIKLSYVSDMSAVLTTFTDNFDSKWSKFDLFYCSYCPAGKRWRKAEEA
jgi:hypothetical protein